MKQEAICFLFWDILDIFHMWNNKNAEWVFLPDASGRDLETLWADH